MKWICVKDRLPNGQWSENHKHLSEDVLIANSCSVEVGYYNKYDGIWFVGCPYEDIWIDKITHWMPLPKNPHERRS